MAARPVGKGKGKGGAATLAVVPDRPEHVVLETVSIFGWRKDEGTEITLFTLAS